MLSSTRRECKRAFVQQPLRTGTPCLRTAKSSRNGEILMYMYPARRSADAKWKRRARDRRALPLLGSGTQCACLLGEFPPQVEGELWAALGFQGRSHLVGTLVRCPRFKEDWVEGSRAPQMPRARPLKISRNLKFDVQCSLGSNPVKSLKIGCDRVGDVHDRSVSSEVRESGPVSRIKSW